MPALHRTTLPALTALAVLAGCQTAPPAPPTSPEVVGEFRAGSGYLKGYLDRKQLPDSLALLPKPPAEGSAEAAADLAVESMAHVTLVFITLGGHIPLAARHR